MKYQKDAHLYRKMIRKRQRQARLRGIVLLAFSAVLMLYSIPCFAASIWDGDSKVASISTTAFSNDINDHQFVAPASDDSAEAGESASTPRVYDVAGFMVGETTGPGLLENEEAVKSAKLRAQAVSVATAERNARLLETQYSSAEPARESTGDPVIAGLALMFSLVCAVFGTRTVLHARTMQGRAIAAAYDSALRAF